MIVEFLVLLAQATAPEAPAAAEPPAPVQAPEASEQIICENVIPTGSRRAIRYCRTVTEEATLEEQADGRLAMYRATTRGQDPGYRGTVPPKLPGYEQPTGRR